MKLFVCLLFTCVLQVNCVSFKTVKKAVVNGRTNDLEQYLDEGASPQMIGPWCGKSLLSWAVLEGQSETLKILLDRGANPNIQDRKTGMTPLIHAVINDSTKLIGMLLKYGADKYLLDSSGKNAYQMAKDKGMDMDNIEDFNK